MQYVFREPNTITNAKNADAQKIGEALEKIAELAGGKLTALAVVDAAKNPRHILHTHFEWDDAEAAKAYRIDQARTIIRCVRVEDDTSAEGHVPAYVSISEKSGTAYRSIAEVKRSPDLQAIVLKAAERDLEGFERRYRELQDVCEIVRSARAVVQRKRARNESRQPLAAE